MSIVLIFTKLQINGRLTGVVSAFDLFSGVLYTHFIKLGPNKLFSIQLLIDHKNAGKVVGTGVSVTILLCFFFV